MKMVSSCYPQSAPLNTSISNDYVVGVFVVENKNGLIPCAHHVCPAYILQDRVFCFYNFD